MTIDQLIEAFRDREPIFFNHERMGWISARITEISHPPDRVSPIVKITFESDAEHEVIKTGHHEWSSRPAIVDRPAIVEREMRLDLALESCSLKPLDTRVREPDVYEPFTEERRRELAATISECDDDPFESLETTRVVSTEEQ